MSTGPSPQHVHVRLVHQLQPPNLREPLLELPGRPLKQERVARPQHLQPLLHDVPARVWASHVQLVGVDHLPRAPQNLRTGPREKLAVTRWLVEQVESGAWMNPSPIGFYFAKLWYFEKLYPMIATVAALTRLR